MGGLGPDGVKALREFVEDGGTLICFNRASEVAIEQFKLPIKNVVGGLPRTEFYVPGSILRIELDTTHPIAQGMPKESIAWAEESPVFEVIEKGVYSVPASAVKIVASYPRAADPLLSGWLLGGRQSRASRSEDGQRPNCSLRFPPAVSSAIIGDLPAFLQFFALAL